jgi:hypothetical protein
LALSEGHEQILEPIEDEAEAELDGEHAERDRQVGLSDAGGSATWKSRSSRSKKLERR